MALAFSWALHTSIILPDSSMLCTSYYKRLKYLKCCNGDSSAPFQLISNIYTKLTSWSSDEERSLQYDDSRLVGLNYLNCTMQSWTGSPGGSQIYVSIVPLPWRQIKGNTRSFLIFPTTTNYPEWVLRWQGRPYHQVDDVTSTVLMPSNRLILLKWDGIKSTHSDQLIY